MNRRSLNITRLAVCSIIVFASVIITILNARPLFQGERDTFASGRNDLGFRVYYQESELSIENPIPNNLHFLMSFTDYIEIENDFHAQFAEPSEVHYSFSATQSFVIRNAGTVNGNLDPIVYEKSIVITEINGKCDTSYLSFTSKNDEHPGGTFVIYPKSHIDAYREFVEIQARQMQIENVTVQGGRYFSAELLVDFSYTLWLPELEHRENSTAGFSIPLSNEVFSFIETGTPSFNINLNNSYAQGSLNLLIIAIALALIITCTAGIIRSILMLQADPNPFNQEAVSILKKYHDEIVCTDSPIDVSPYISMKVTDFKELLKLSVNLNKHIMGFINGEQSEFCVVVDNYAYLYKVSYTYTHNRDEA